VRWIDWSATGRDELVQNISTIVGTGTGEVPLARDFGTPQGLVDQPQSVVGAQLQAAVIRSVRTYEPRVAVSKVSLVPNADGVLQATVEIGPP
jgi:phage baseplate assembly protein W